MLLLAQAKIHCGLAHAPRIPGKLPSGHQPGILGMRDFSLAVQGSQAMLVRPARALAIRGP